MASNKALIEMIAQGQAQRIRENQLMQQTQADYDAWLKQQPPQVEDNFMQQVQADFDAWANANPIQTQPVQKVETPKKEEAIPSLADFFKPTTASGRDINKETAQKLHREDYQRQQQLEQIQAEQKHNGKGTDIWNASVDNTLDFLNSKEFQDVVKQGKATNALIEKEKKQAEENKKIEEQIASFDQYNTEAVPTLTDEQKALEEQILNSDRYVPDTSKDKNWRDGLLTKDQKEAVIRNTTPEMVSEWLSPDRQLTDLEKAQARAYASSEIQKYDRDANHQPKNATEEEKQHYKDMVDLLNKTSAVASFAANAVKGPYNLVDYVGKGAKNVGDQIGGLSAALTDKLGITEGATQRHNENVEASNQAYEDKDASFRQELANANTQHPLASAAGTMTGQIAMYAATNPIFDGIAEGVGVTSALAKFFINQGAQNVQDLVLDTAPLVKQLMADGSLSDADKREVFGNILWNAIGNGVMGGFQAIPDIAKYASDVEINRALKNQNILEGADNLAKVAEGGPIFKNVEPIPGMEDTIKSTSVNNNDSFIKNSLEELDNTRYYEGAKNVEANNGGLNYGTDIRDQPGTIRPGSGSNTEGNIKPDISQPGRENAFTGQVGQTDSPVLRQSAVNNTDGAIRESMSNANIVDMGMKYSTDVQKYSDALKAAKEGNEHGVFVSWKSPEELQEIVDNGGKLLLDDYGRAGVIVAPNGDIEGVFHNTKLSKQLGLNSHGAMPDLMISAIANGGDRLDCYGEDLARMYMRYGFEPVAVSEYVPGKPWSTDMDAWKANELKSIEGTGEKPTNTDVYILKLRDGWTVDDAIEAASKNTLADYADHADLNIDTINKSVPEEIKSLTEEAQYDAMMDYRNSKLDMNLQYFGEKQPNEGAFFDGVNPDDVMKERGTSRHIRNDGTPMKMEGVSDEVVADFKDDPDMYKVLRNSDTVAKADKVYSESADPLVDFRDMVRQHDPAALPLGHQLAKEYSAAGNHDAAAQIYREMGEQLTKAGQFSQAAAINMMKNDPLTALAYFERELDALNKAGAEKYGKKWKDFVLSDEEKALFDNITPGDTDAIKNAVDKIGQRIEKEYPASAWEKVLEFRRVAMLFNSRTIIRNTLANPPTAALRYVSDRIEGLGQYAAHLINPEFEITQAIRGSNKETRKLATQIFDSDKVKAMLEGSAGRLSEIPKVGDYAKSKQMFKGGVLSDWVNTMTNGGVEKLNAKLGKKNAKSLLELGRNSAYKALEVTDNPMVRENFISRLGSYIRAKDIKNVADVPDEAILMAYEEAMKATYKDNSFMVNALRKAKGTIESIGNNVVPGLGDMASQAIIPYVQAPGNIAARTIDYSAIGLGKGINKIIKGANSGDMKLVAKGIEEASKGTTGTLAAALGYALYKSGVITGTYSNDKDQKAFEKQHGFREFALRYKVNGQTKYDTIDWMQPFVDTIMPGVLLAQAIENSDEYDSDILKYFGYEGTLPGKVAGIAKEATKKEVNYFFDATPLKNLGELFKGGYGGDTDIAGNLWQNTVEDFASALVPAGVNAVAKSVDPVQKQITDPSNSFGTFVNGIGAKIPGLSNKLPTKYDTWGQPMTYGNSKGEAAFAKMLYPGEHTSDKSDEIDTEISRLFDVTNNAAVFPQVAPNKVGENKLNASEVSKYQEDVGKRNRSLVEEFVNSDYYDNLDDKGKAEGIANLYGASKAITERDLFGKGVADNSNYKTAIAAYDDAGGGEKGIKAMVEYYEGKSASDSAGLNANSNAAKAIQQDIKDGNTEAAQEKIDAATVLPELGLDKPATTYAYYKAQEQIPDLTPEDFAKTYKAIDKDHNQALKKKDEVIPYMNSQKMSYSEGMKFWKAYANKDWKLPTLTNGTWK